MWEKKHFIYKWMEILIAACFYYSGLVKLVRWWAQRFTQSLVILNYHSASGGNLRQHLLYLRRHYRILHLEKALEELSMPCKNRLQKRDRRTLLALTFDDGYHDNYTHAQALAQKLKVPITIFLIPGYIENGKRFWWLEGDQLVAQAQVRKATIEEYTYHLDKLDERKALAKVIDNRARYAKSVSEREDFLISLRKTLAVPPLMTLEEKATSPLTWEEVWVMEDSKWISFGAHTMHHPMLACLTDAAEVQYEVSECRAVLEQQLGHPVRIFAYPFGQIEHIGESGFPAVQKAGYDWAVTTVNGFNTPQTNQYFLRRIPVDVNEHWLLVAARASGVWRFFSRLFWLPITLIKRLLRSTR